MGTPKVTQILRRLLMETIYASAAQNAGDDDTYFRVSENKCKADVAVI